MYDWIFDENLLRHKIIDNKCKWIYYNHIPICTYDNPNKGVPMNLTPIFKLLSDETRLRVVMLLSQGELCVCEMTGILEESQPKVSKVLSKLRDMSLVTDDRKEKFVFYSLTDTNGMLNNITDYISGHLEEYPIIKKDLSRLKAKENYVDNCVLTSLLEVSNNK